MKDEEFARLYEEILKKVEENIKNGSVSEDSNISKAIMLLNRNKVTSLNKFLKKVMKALITSEGFYVTSFTTDDIILDNIGIEGISFLLKNNHKEENMEIYGSENYSQLYKLLSVKNGQKERTVTILPKNIVAVDSGPETVMNILSFASHRVEKAIEKKYGRIEASEDRFGVGKIILTTKRVSITNDKIIDSVRDNVWKKGEIKISRLNHVVQALVKTNDTEGLIILPYADLNYLYLKSLAYHFGEKLKIGKYSKKFNKKVAEFINPYNKLNELVSRHKNDEITIAKTDFKNPTSVSKTLMSLIMKDVEVGQSRWGLYETYHIKDKFITFLPKGDAIITSFNPQDQLEKALYELDTAVRSKYKHYTESYIINGEMFYLVDDETTTNKKINLRPYIDGELMSINVLKVGKTIRGSKGALTNYFESTIKRTKQKRKNIP
mgnify:CR=1 FL=1